MKKKGENNRKKRSKSYTKKEKSKKVRAYGSTGGCGKGKGPHIS